MKIFSTLLLILFCYTFSSAASAGCELFLGPGAVVRLSEGKSGGMASIGCVFDDEWVVEAHWIGEQRIYDDTVVIDGYPMLTAQRMFAFREGKRLRPFVTLGLGAKGAQRCHFNGDLDCNRQLPLPFAFVATLGVRFGDDFILTVGGHMSNNSLDFGEEKKNLGLDHVSFKMVVWRW